MRRNLLCRKREWGRIRRWHWQLHARHVVRPQGDVVTAQDLLEGHEEAALKGGALNCDHTVVYTPPA